MSLSPSLEAKQETAIAIVVDAKIDYPSGELSALLCHRVLTPILSTLLPPLSCQ